jgi:hypothetical protein
MSNYSTEDRTSGNLMPEPTTSKSNNDESTAPVHRGCIDENTCACGEKHQYIPGDVSPMMKIAMPATDVGMNSNVSETQVF